MDGNIDVRFTAVEQAASRGHGEALFQLGRWYDPAHAEAEGSPLPPNAAIAVRYYSDAAEKGYTEAEAALQSTCEALSESSDSIAQAAMAAYCSE